LIGVNAEQIRGGGIFGHSPQGFACACAIDEVREKHKNNHGDEEDHNLYGAQHQRLAGDAQID
jgi:hypothetical protein